MSLLYSRLRFPPRIRQPVRRMSPLKSHLLSRLKIQPFYHHMSQVSHRRWHPHKIQRLLLRLHQLGCHLHFHRKIRHYFLLSCQPDLQLYYLLKILLCCLRLNLVCHRQLYRRKFRRVDLHRSLPKLLRLVHLNALVFRRLASRLLHHPLCLPAICPQTSRRLSPHLHLQLITLQLRSQLVERRPLQLQKSPLDSPQ